MRLYLAVTLCQTVSGGSLVLGFPEISIFVPIDIPALIFSSLPSGASMLYASFCLHLFCCFVFIIWYFSFSYSLKNVFKQINFCGYVTGQRYLCWKFIQLDPSRKREYRLRNCFYEQSAYWYLGMFY